MSNRTLLTLGVIALVLVIWAAVQSSISNRRASAPETLTYLIQGLDPDGIASVVVREKEDSVTLKREGRGFVVVGKDDYPADNKQINDLIQKCTEIQTTELYTSSPDNHDSLEVSEAKARYVVKFFKADGSLLTGVAVGKDMEMGQGTYVRLLPGDNVYGTLKSPWIRSKATDYVNQEIVSAKREDIESVTVGSKDGEYTLKAAGEGDAVVMDNVPAGKKLKSSDARTVLNSLVGFRFDDVKKDSGGLTFDGQFVCRLKDSTVYTVKIAQKDSKTYVTFSADFTDQTPVTIDKGKTDSEEELKKKEAKLLARDKSVELTTRHRGWVYEIADWKAKNLTKKLSELLEDEKKAEDPNKPKTAEVPTTAGQSADGVAAVKPGPAKSEDPNATKTIEPNAPKVEEPNAAKPK